MVVASVGAVSSTRNDSGNGRKVLLEQRELLKKRKRRERKRERESELFKETVDLSAYRHYGCLTSSRKDEGKI